MSFRNPSPQLDVVLKWYEAITVWNFDHLSVSMADTYKHTTLPASAGEAPKDKAQGIAHAKAVAALQGHAPMKVRGAGLQPTCTDGRSSNVLRPTA
jgi:hypothetical protein